MPPAPPGLDPDPEGHVTDVAVVTANIAILKKLASIYTDVNWHVATYTDVLTKNKLCLPADPHVLAIDAASRSSFNCGRVAHMCTLLYQALQECTARNCPSVIIVRRNTTQESWKSLLRRWKPYETSHC